MTAPISNVPAERSSETATADVAFPVVPGARRLATFFEEEESALLGYAIGLVGRRSVAEELVQDAFLRLHQLWEQVENPRAWMYRSLRNLALNHLRDHSRETVVEAPESSDTSESPLEELDRMEAVGTMRMLLAELSPEDQTLLRLKYHEDLKYQDISQRTGLSVSNVGYKLHHLLKGLADSLRVAGIDGSRR
jgi:RNA polymerase sigma-70 factor (ECF subfamily)